MARSVFLFAWCIYFCFITLLKTRLKINQLKKVRFIKVDELKVIQIELFEFLHVMRVAFNPSDFFCMDHFSSSESYLHHSILSFQIWNFTCMWTRQLEFIKINSNARICVFSGKWVKITQIELFSIFKCEYFIRVYVLVQFVMNVQFKDNA